MLWNHFHLQDSLYYPFLKLYIITEPTVPSLFLLPYMVKDSKCSPDITWEDDTADICKGQ